MGRILVTGGTGFIGSHTVVELIEAGYDVMVVDNLENSFPEVLDGISKITGKKPFFIEADLRHVSAVKELFSEYGPVDAIIHFAAYKAVGESMDKPIDYYHNNLLSLINLLKNMQSAACANMVFSSSCTVYGQPDELPVTELSPTRRPFSPYGNTKKVSEEMLEEVCNTGWLSAVALRYFNPIGAHQSGLIGELPIGRPNNLVPYITQTAAGKLDMLTIHGNDYPTPDGTCIRDYIHVSDVAKAHVFALKRMLSGKTGQNFEVLNLGTGKGLSVMEIVESFQRVNNLKLPYKIGPRRPGDVIEVWADPTLANNKLGWEALEDIDSMMKTAWQWQLNIPKIYGDRF